MTEQDKGRTTADAKADEARLDDLLERMAGHINDATDGRVRMVRMSSQDLLGAFARALLGMSEWEEDRPESPLMDTGQWMGWLIEQAYIAAGQTTKDTDNPTRNDFAQGLFERLSELIGGER